MRVCHCTLGGTKACDECPNNTVYLRSVWQPELMNLDAFTTTWTSHEWPDDICENGGGI